MSQRQAAFRADFRTRIAPAYFGWAHVALIYALGLAGDLVSARGRSRSPPGTSSW